MRRTHSRRRVAELLMIAVLGQLSLSVGAQTGGGVPPARLSAARQIVDEAARLAGSIQDPRALYVLWTLAETQARVGDIPGALRSMGAVPPSVPRVQGMVDAWSAIALAQASAGDLPGALVTLAKAFPTQSRDDALGGLAVGEAGQGNISGAMAMATLISDATSRDRALWTIAQTQARRGDAAGALRTLGATPFGAHPELATTTAALEASQGNLTEARRLLSTVSTPERDVLALLGLVAYLARAGDVPAALALAHRIPPDSSHGGVWHYMALLAVVAGQATGGDIAGALATAAATPKIEDAGRAIVTEILARRGQVQAASRLLASVGPDADIHLGRAVSAVAVAQAERGDLAGAVQTVQLAPHSGVVEETLAQIAEAQVFAGDPGGAAATAGRIGDPQGRTRALWRVAVARARAGDPAPLLSTANPSGGAAARVTDLALAARDVLEDRRFDPDEPGAYLGTQRPRWTR